ncbi:MAG: hypothetical protein AB8E82_04215 [Aureispira sp.]
MKYLSIALLFFGAILMNACENAEGLQTVYDKAEGTWRITSTEFLTSTIPGDGSTLTFDNCSSPPCAGQDYKASDATTGAFTYEFDEVENLLIINDPSQDGGNYNDTFDILNFTATNLRITSGSLFGLNVTIEMDKQ